MISYHIEINITLDDMVMEMHCNSCSNPAEAMRIAFKYWKKIPLEHIARTDVLLYSYNRETGEESMEDVTESFADF